MRCSRGDLSFRQHSSRFSSVVQIMCTCGFLPRNKAVCKNSARLSCLQFWNLDYGPLRKMAALLLGQLCRGMLLKLSQRDSSYGDCNMEVVNVIVMNYNYFFQKNHCEGGGKRPKQQEFASLERYRSCKSSLSSRG